MKRLTVVAIIAIMLGIFGCPGPNPGPCDNVNCVNGDCVNGACRCDDGWQGELCNEQNLCYDIDCSNHGNCVDGDCACDTNYYGEDCSIFFDCSDSLACALVCPEDSGQLIVTGPVLTGYYAEYDVGTFSKCAYLFIRELIAREVPDPDEGRVLSQTYGMTVQAVDADLPRNEDGTWNDVLPQIDVKIHFAGHRARVLRHVEDGGLGSFDYIEPTIEDDGSSITVNELSDFLLNNRAPKIEEVIMPSYATILEVTVDIDYLDEGNSSDYNLIFEVAKDGTLLPSEKLDSNTLLVTMPSGGIHDNLSVTVRDQYGLEATVTERTVEVDLCADATCEPWQTCRELDGECVGIDPCVPNPCGDNYGTCNNATGEAVCDCHDGYTSALCDACNVAEGYEGIFPDCVLNLCFGVDCGVQYCDPNDGGCYDCLEDGHCDDNLICNGVETCDGSGSCNSGTPVNCPDDGDECNGTEACNPDNGTCQHFDAIDCGGQLCRPADGACVDCLNDGHCGNSDFCDGAETCNNGTCEAGSDPCSGQFCDEVGNRCVQCLNDGHCDDGIFCDDINTCLDGMCVTAGPVCAPTEMCDEDNDRCVECLGDGDCDDSLACTGTETCDGNGDCQNGILETCNSHGDCQEPAGNCNCNSEYDGTTCDECATGYGNYPTCGLNVIMGSVTIDCSGGVWPGHCVAGGFTYPVPFTATNATNCTGSAEVISGSGTPGTVTNCDTSSCDFTTGSTGSNIIRVTVTCTGDGDPDNGYVDVTQE